MGNDLVILAAGNYWESAARYLNRTSSNRENLLLLTFAAAIAGIWISLILWEWYRASRPAAAAPTLSLFEQLCQAHRLGPDEVCLLSDAAQECRAPGPEYLFVQPEILDRLGQPGHPQADASRKLHERLFGTL